VNRKISRILSCLTLSGLVACGGGGDEGDSSPSTPQPVAGTPENPGTITVQRFQSGVPVPRDELYKPNENMDYSPYWSQADLVKHIELLSDKKIPFALAAINGYTVGTGYTVGHVNPSFYTQKTEYINPETGQYYTYDEFSGGVQEPNAQRISLSSHWRGLLPHFRWESTRHQTFLHETCHAIETMIGYKTKRGEAVNIYRQAIAQARYAARLDQIPPYFKMTNDGGMQTDITRAASEAFADICGELLYIKSVGETKFPTNIVSHTDVSPLLPEFTSYVRGVLDRLDQEYAGKPWAYDIQGAPGDSSKKIIGPNQSKP
jgi:hypothetical protein